MLVQGLAVIVIVFEVIVAVAFQRQENRLGPRSLPGQTRRVTALPGRRHSRHEPTLALTISRTRAIPGRPILRVIIMTIIMMIMIPILIIMIIIIIIIIIIITIIIIIIIIIIIMKSCR